MLRLWRTSAAARAAVGALFPLVQQSRHRLGQIPPRMWSEPYMLGLVMTVITLTAQQRSSGRLTSEDLGHVQVWAWQRLAGMPGDMVGEQLCRLSAGGDAHFQWGCRRGVRLFSEMQRETASAGGPVADWTAAGPGETGSGTAATTAELWQSYFDDRIHEIAAEMG